MSGRRIGTGIPGRAGHVGPLLGLVLLIVAHLAGTVHGSSYDGPHLAVGIEAAASTHPEAGIGHGRGPVLGHDHESDDHAPAHHHEADDHIEHAADRPRASADATVVLGSGHSGADVAPPPVAGATAAYAAWAGPPQAARASDSRGTLALHCVWRF
ncbi:hypothetical protein DIZ27_01510 [Streptomyces sp. NWU339]|uniref:hypothetical protein n=1 Tax=Streptomyces sp. NWU339 TaxID=2185284 RepID=UPI000D67F045|nr:hypothetical protein [Streptomyces sp. NWU339]PWI12297.1 hypothetical protein DIZ27_01510 [Streptomyces sp. NWU339]